MRKWATPQGAAFTGCGTIANRLAKRLGANIIDRGHEMAVLEELALPDGPSVAYVHGPYGIGKSALLSAMEASMAERAVAVARLRGGSVEPRPEAFTAALGRMLDADAQSLAALADALQALRTPLVLMIDDVDELRLIATWLRREFVPSLPANVRLVLAGRSQPPAAWVAEFGDLYRAIRLGPLSRREVMERLQADGHEPAAVERFWAISAGHPLTLRLLMQSAHGGWPNTAAAAGEVADAILADAGPDLARMAEAAAVLRRATRLLLTAMLGREAANDFDAFAALPFVRLDREGHFLAEPVRQSLAERLAATQPDRYAALRRTAAAWISDRLRTASASERWRHMADLLHLVEHSQVRDAFFPPEAEAPPVEPAEGNDFAAILRITEEAAGRGERGTMEAWMRLLPHRFSVARGRKGEVLAFYVFARASDPVDSLSAADPLLSLWLAREKSDGGRGEVLFVRQLLAVETRRNAPERAACLLDLKRAYFEQWNLSRVYSTATPDAIANPVYRRLGFRPLSEPTDELPGSMVLELPTSGLIGWVSTLVGAPPVAATDELSFTFVRDRREITVGREVRPLTRLEADVLAMLLDHAPAVVAREDLISAIWQRSFVGSNVVETIVSSLRKKLRPCGNRIVTVPKAGYRFKADQP